MKAKRIITPSGKKTNMVRISNGDVIRMKSEILLFNLVLPKLRDALTLLLVMAAIMLKDYFAIVLLRAL